METVRRPASREGASIGGHGCTRLPAAGGAAHRAWATALKGLCNHGARPLGTTRKGLPSLEPTGCVDSNSETLLCSDTCVSAASTLPTTCFPVSVPGQPFYYLQSKASESHACLGIPTFKSLLQLWSMCVTEMAPCQPLLPSSVAQRMFTAFGVHHLPPGHCHLPNGLCMASIVPSSPCQIPSSKSSPVFADGDF